MSIGELPVETVNIEFICPIGVPFYYSGMELPSDRYVWVEGQEFDPSDGVLLKLFPSGFLPDPRYDFFRVVDKSEPTLVKHEQSVQPLTFIGNVLPSHGHTTNGRGSNYSSSWGAVYANDRARNAPGINVPGNTYTFTNESVVVATSAGTPTGTIGGTGAKTAPQHMDWHCIMRVK